ncbi:MAG: DJ-1/PfpI family protein [Rhodothermales bacterium]
MPHRCLLGLLFAPLLIAGCGAVQSNAPSPPASTQENATLPQHEGVLTAGFVGLETVYNSELMAPYDILQHTVFRDSLHYIRPFIVSPTHAPFTTFEGITITPHYSFEDAPPIDVLVIPSTGNSMTGDLEDEALMTWLKAAVEQARYVITVCDGAFPLAATGALNGRIATTFPGDRDRFAEMFPAIDVRYDANFVVDGKYITSVGGALSYEPALYLVESLYGVESARRTAQGLVLDWDVTTIPHFIARR